MTVTTPTKKLHGLPPSSVPADAQGQRKPRACRGFRSSTEERLASLDAPILHFVRGVPHSSTSISMAPSALGGPWLAAFEHLLGDERGSHRRWPAGVERQMGN